MPQGGRAAGEFAGELGGDRALDVGASAAFAVQLDAVDHQDLLGAGDDRAEQQPGGHLCVRFGQRLPGCLHGGAVEADVPGLAGAPRQVAAGQGQVVDVPAQGLELEADVAHMGVGHQRAAVGEHHPVELEQPGAGAQPDDRGAVVVVDAVVVAGVVIVGSHRVVVVLGRVVVAGQRSDAARAVVGPIGAGGTGLLAAAGGEQTAARQHQDQQDVCAAHHGSIVTRKLRFHWARTTSPSPYSVVGTT